jgi:hypothetical protein
MTGKRLLLAAAFAIAVFVAVRAVSRWRAESTYEKFAEAWTRGDAAEAKKYAEQDVARAALEDHALLGLCSGTIIEAFRGTRYEVLSEETVSDGLRKEVTQTIFFDPPGVTSAIGGAMFTHIHHSVTLQKSPDGWRVVAFEPRFVDMGELRRSPGRLEPHRAPRRD